MNGLLVFFVYIFFFIIFSKWATFEQEMEAILFKLEFQQEVHKTLLDRLEGSAFFQDH